MRGDGCNRMKFTELTEFTTKRPDTNGRACNRRAIMDYSASAARMTRNCRDGTIATPWDLPGK